VALTNPSLSISGVKPWERRPDESGIAFQAFEIFLNLGKTRSLVQAYRNKSSKPHARQANGTWNGWSQRYDWFARALAYDNHNAAAAKRGVERATQKAAEKAVTEWHEEKQRQRRLDLRLGRKFMDKSDGLANFPVVESVTSEDGSYTFNPIHAREMALAARVGETGRGMCWGAINDGLAEEQAPPAEEEAASGPELPPLPAGAVAEALREAEADRLETMLKSVWGKAVAGDPVSVGLVLRIMERRDRLLGLDQPSASVLAASGDRGGWPIIVEVADDGDGNGNGNGDGSRGTGPGNGTGGVPGADPDGGL
jgi:hypothetical protein